MLVLLLFQMTRQFLPGAVHEATGIALGACVAAHVVLNRRWFAALGRGRWTALRVVSTTVNGALLVVFAAMVVSGLAMSGIAVDLGLAGHTTVLRGVHALCALVGAGLAVALGQRRARRPSSGRRSQ